MAMTNEMQGHDIRLRSTFEDWWRRSATSSTTSAVASSSTSARSTWKGMLFGSASQKPIDYIAADIVTSRRLIAGHFAPPMSYPSDHFALGSEYDPHQDLG